jgi:hypothetical protein
MKKQELNLSEKIFNKDLIIKEYDFQTGEIEFSMTGELIPLEKLEVILKEFIKDLKEGSMWLKPDVETNMIDLDNLFKLIDNLTGEKLNENINLPKL